jgi:hypothetical protein
MEVQPVHFVWIVVLRQVSIFYDCCNSFVIYPFLAALVSFYSASDCYNYDSSSNYNLNSCATESDNWPSIRSMKVTCSTGEDSSIPTSVDWFAFSGYSDASCTNHIENDLVKSKYCIDTSEYGYTSSEYYDYPVHRRYYGSSNCQGSYGTSIYSTATCQPGGGETAFGNSYMIRYIAATSSAKDSSIYYTVTQVSESLKLNFHHHN